MAEVPRIHDEFKCRQAKVQFAMVWQVCVSY
jgi:hypothetical protein